MDDETPREKWATYFGLTVTLIPALLASGFMPEWNVLPFAGWLAIATVGAAIAGAIAAKRWTWGAVTGALMGAGVLGGIWLYVTVRGALTGNHTFFKLELVVGALIGAAPGALLYSRFASPDPLETGTESIRKRGPLDPAQCEINRATWTQIIAFYENLTGKEQRTHVLPILTLVRELAATDHAERFRAGQSMFTLIVSTTDQYGLEKGDACVVVTPHNKIGEFLVEYWNEPGGRRLEQKICSAADLRTTVESALARLWSETRE